MQNISMDTHIAELEQSDSLWRLAWRRLKRNRSAMLSLMIVALYFVLLLLSSTGVIVKDWNKEVAIGYAPPSFLQSTGPTTEQLKTAQSTDLSIATSTETYGISDPLAADMQAIQAELKNNPQAQQTLAESLPFGADRWGQDIIAKTIKAGETSILVGLLASLLAVGLGTVIGAISGYFGGWIDDLFNWIYNVFTSIPYMLLILAVAAVLQQKGMTAVILILGLTGWTGTYRLIRAEYIKHKSREYVLAAKAIGVSHFDRLIKHIFPNVSHVTLVQASILLVSFIKSEVILSFLGFGVPVGTASWGSMLNDAQSEFLLGKWWQLVAATVAMTILVTAFSIFTDALRDALDPKLKS